MFNDIKASDLIRLLEDAIEKHGDLPVFSSGQDYPGNVSSVYLEKCGSPYIPKGSLVIRTNSY